VQLSRTDAGAAFPQRRVGSVRGFDDCLVLLDVVTNGDVECSELEHAEDQAGRVRLLVRPRLDVLAVAERRTHFLDGQLSLLHLDDGVHLEAQPAHEVSPTITRATADADGLGAEVAVLAVSHVDCEDLSDRMRAIRAARGELRGPTLSEDRPGDRSIVPTPPVIACWFTPTAAPAAITTCSTERRARC